MHWVSIAYGLAQEELHLGKHRKSPKRSLAFVANVKAPSLFVVDNVAYNVVVVWDSLTCPSFMG